MVLHHALCDGVNVLGNTWDTLTLKSVVSNANSIGFLKELYMNMRVYVSYNLLSKCVVVWCERSCENTWGILINWILKVYPWTLGHWEGGEGQGGGGAAVYRITTFHHAVMTYYRILSFVYMLMLCVVCFIA